MTSFNILQQLTVAKKAQSQGPYTHNSSAVVDTIPTVVKFKQGKSIPDFCQAVYLGVFAATVVLDVQVSRGGVARTRLSMTVRVSIVLIGHTYITLPNII